MPFIIPAIPAGLSLLGWLGGAFGTVISYLIAVWASRLARVAAAISAVLALGGYLYSDVIQIADQLLLQMPPASAAVMNLVIPGNFWLCVSALITTKLSCMAYSFARFCVSWTITAT